MFEIAFAITWLVLAFLAWAVADNKGRWGVGYFLASMVLSPVVVLIIALCVSRDVGRLEDKAIAAGQSKRCPHCAEVIRVEADVCRFCGRES